MEKVSTCKAARKTLSFQILSVCLSIQERVKLMNGTMELTSTKNVGTKYVIEAHHEKI